MKPVRNFAVCIVDGLYSSSQTTITLQAGEGAKLPNPATEGEFDLTWFNFTDYPNPADDPNKEIVTVTARTGDVLTLATRTGGTSKNLSGKTYLMILAFNKAMYDSFVQALFVPPYKSYAPSAGGTVTLDHIAQKRHLVQFPAGNITLAADGNQRIGQTFIIELKQDATGGRTVTWFSGISWAGGSAPSLTTTANKTDSFGFIVTGVNTYQGFVIGQNI